MVETGIKRSAEEDGDTPSTGAKVHGTRVWPP